MTFQVDLRPDSQALFISRYLMEYFNKRAWKYFGLHFGSGLEIKMTFVKNTLNIYFSNISTEATAKMFMDAFDCMLALNKEADNKLFTNIKHEHDKIMLNLYTTIDEVNGFILLKGY